MMDISGLGGIAPAIFPLRTRRASLLSYFFLAICTTMIMFRKMRTFVSSHRDYNTFRNINKYGVNLAVTAPDSLADLTPTLTRAF